MQAEKLAAVGRFSSGVAHEVKNPLAIILMQIEVDKGQIKETKKAQAWDYPSQRPSSTTIRENCS